MTVPAGSTPATAPRPSHQKPLPSHVFERPEPAWSGDWRADDPTDRERFERWERAGEADTREDGLVW